MSPANAIDMLTEDHKQVSDMFERFERQQGEQRDRVVHEIIQSLNTHSRIEEQVLYPFIRAEVPGGDELMDEAEREHQEAKDAMARVSEMSPDDPEFEDAFRTLRQGVEHHVQEEEGEVFPKLAQATDEAGLAELGQRLAQARTLSTREDRSLG
ncbi:MAG: hemerythrin domain-containing protein [Actinomycetota bacterium]|nr:hemerythrin domain-containing protein [Actinomycetota bacterium]